MRSQFAFAAKQLYYRLALPSLIGIVLFVSISNATIRPVPGVYPTITNAASACTDGDTILLARGNYYGGVSFQNNLTIASSYLFIQDSTTIDSTIWVTDTNRIQVNNHSLRFVGIKFRAPSQPMGNAGILIGNMVNIRLDHCKIDGAYDLYLNFFRGLFYIAGSNPSTFEMNDCRYMNDTIGAVNIVVSHNCSVTLNRCFFDGRTTDSYAWINISRGDLTIRNSIIHLKGEGIFANGGYQIENSTFVGLGSRGFYFGGHIEDSIRVVRDCVFDLSRITPENSSNVIRMYYNNNYTLFLRCAFQNSLPGNRSLIIASGVPTFKFCTFENNQQVLLAADRFVVDSCQFLNNGLPLFSRETGAELDSVKITNSDFIGNNPQFSSVLFGAAVFNAISAPNCYWGDPTGPNHPLNPNGLGQLLPAFVNPFPFRTTPVFPENGISDPGTRVTYSLPQSPQFTMFPNPTNASTSIRFTVPQTTPVTGSVYDRTGRIVSTFSIQTDARGTGVYPLQCVNTPSGLYFVRLSSSQASTTQSLVIVK